MNVSDQRVSLLKHRTQIVYDCLGIDEVTLCTLVDPFSSRNWHARNAQPMDAPVTRNHDHHGKPNVLRSPAREPGQSPKGCCQSKRSKTGDDRKKKIEDPRERRNPL